jgi:hypothetical protein
MTATAETSAVPDLATLQQRAAQRAAERAGGEDRLRGHIVCDGWSVSSRPVEVSPPG